MVQNMIRIPELTGSDSEKKREEIREYFNQVYDRYESLFELLGEERAFYVRPERLRHPLIFYYGHTASFFINKFKLAGIIDRRIDPELESLFAVGVDEMGWDDLDEMRYAWPTSEEARAYRQKVRALVNEVIGRLPMTLPITESSPWWVILMGIEHENIHIETSSVLVRQLPIDLVRSSREWPLCPDSGDAPENTWVDLPGGSISLGKRRDAKRYGWDNEYGEHRTTLPPFKASRYLVSHAEFLPFVEEGGYGEARFWDEEGDAWRRFAKVSMPTFWLKKEGIYHLRTLTHEIVLPMNWPVEVNFHEATAFCRWLSEKRGKQITLPTEDEYMQLYTASALPEIGVWGEKAPANIDLEYYASSVPVDRFAHGPFYDLIGNVWQWSRTPIYPFDGFRVHPLYDDFTVPTFDGKHNLIKGGSWASCGNPATVESRYAFRRHFFQHAGFRYLESHYEEQIETKRYESEREIAQRCDFDWGEPGPGISNYPAECAGIAVELMGERPRRRALDLACGTGRSSFELARGFDEVVGIDFSARLIRHAEEMKRGGLLRYVMKSEGKLERFQEVTLASSGLREVEEKVTFWQGDACNLKAHFRGFDLVLAANLLEKLYEPRKFLESLADRLLPGALLLLTSSCDWQEEVTPEEHWIGGFKRDGESVTTLDGLREILEPDFVFLESRDIPLMLREADRKFRYVISQASVWERAV